MNSELKRVWKEAVVVLSRYSFDTFQQGLRKTLKHFRQYGRRPDQAFGEYKLRVLSLHRPAW
jgi:hypothetical protein